jgi:hypothetical protein
MKPLSLRYVAIAAVCLLLCSAFSLRKIVFPAQISPAQASASPQVAAKDNTHYYFYLDEDDSFDAYNTVADEIVRQEGITGHYVSTSPSGGTLLVSGYANNVYQHTIWPSSNLYSH